MIQVCSACGTRWNVRDKQRVWCPRCHGSLMAPSTEARGGPNAADAGWGRPGDPSSPARAQVPAPAAARSTGQRTPVRLPPGYRWIAVRPGSAPTPHRIRRPLGPTPRYEGVPRWGLWDQIDPSVGPPSATVRGGPSARAVRLTLYTAGAVLGAAAFVHLLRYVLLIINRTTLLPPVVAAVAVWSGVLASAAAIAAVIACSVVLTRWLIARRAAVFTHYRLTEPRSVRTLWAGCLVPLINLVLAPVYVIEMATAEMVYTRLRKPIVVWWLLWVFSTAVSAFALATSFTTDAQGIADNTVSMTIAYLLALAAVVATARMYFGFERKPVERPAHRWVVVAADQQRAAQSVVAVEPEGQDPAA